MQIDFTYFIRLVRWSVGVLELGESLLNHNRISMLINSVLMVIPVSEVSSIVWCIINLIVLGPSSTAYHFEHYL